MRAALSRFLACSCLLGLHEPACAGEIGFVETFVLAADRTQALEQLIPGTEEYYFYHALDRQARGELDEVPGLLEAWTKRHGRTGLVDEIENRQILLSYGRQPEESLRALVERLGLRFDHERRVPGQEPRLPSRLDPEAIARETLVERALRRHPRTLDGFTDRALDWVATLNLDPDRRRHLLGRLEWPDVPELAQLVVDDLEYRGSRGFGSLSIHRALLQAQLDACLRLKPDLITQGAFVNTYLTKLQPNPDVDWRSNAAAREAYLEDLWRFVSRLEPAFNSLKAHVLYHRLVHDRSQGRYDLERFLEYLKLPRRVGYLPRAFTEGVEYRRYSADLSADFVDATRLAPIGVDEPLVRSYLMHFFGEGVELERFATYIERGYLERLYAETRILAGEGDMERWYSMLPPAEYQALLERVDIDFAVENEEHFEVDEQIGLDVYLKNVPSLIVKVFEINTFEYYRTHGREVDTAVDLDGLVANEEETYLFDEPPLRRIKRRFEFPSLDRRGVFAIEFIGGGKSSRALVRKGRLRFLLDTGPAGQVFTLLDEANRRLPDAALWIGGHRYEASDDGTVAVPFTNQPGRQQVILVHDEFATLDSFEHEGEEYHLTAGLYVHREDLLTKRTAELLIRPSLLLNAVPITLSLLEEPRLVIASTSRDDVSSTREIGDLELHEDRETVVEFQVPPDLREVRFTLRARVENLSQGEKVDVEASVTYSVNSNDENDALIAAHLARYDRGYVVEVLGKNGEPAAHQAVNLTLHHRDFRDEIPVSLQSDANGRIDLGELAGIDALEVAPAATGNASHHRPLRDAHNLPGNLHGRAGEELSVPYMGNAQGVERSAFSLLERRGATWVRDRFDSLGLENGFLKLRGLPRGDYELLLRELDQRILVRLSEGEKAPGYVTSEYRQLEVQNSTPLQVVSVASQGESVHIRLANASEFARVHVLAARYLSAYPVFPGLESAAPPEPAVALVPRPPTHYVAGRDIGDEYRYILERRSAKKYPGNMLARPSLLLFPWALRDTETDLQQAQLGDMYAKSQAPSETARRRGRDRLQEVGFTRPAHVTPNLDFLGETAVVLANLTPDEDGVVTVERAALGAHSLIHVVAVDPENTAYRVAALPEAPMDFVDLRLESGFDPERHYTEQKEVSFVDAGESLEVADIATAEFEIFDTLARVHQYFVTLSGNEHLVEFAFVLRWPELERAEKLENYSRYACHELNFFLYQKDPAFFAEVVAPHLRSKREKTFLDHWLLEDDLSGYLDPWAFGELNVVERILLARRIEGERESLRRHVEDLLALEPSDPAAEDLRFRIALLGRALEEGDAFGVELQRERLAEQRRALVREELSVGQRAAPAARAGAVVQEMRELADAEALPQVEKKAELESLRLAAKAAAEDAAVTRNGLAGEEAEADLGALRAGDRFYWAKDLRRPNLAQFYREVETTKEWAETHYYRVPIEKQDEELIEVDAFWRDFAAHAAGEPFFSSNLGEAAGNFAEMMLALAVLDLPFAAGEHASEASGAKFTLRPATPLLAVHKQIRPAEPAADTSPILLSQSFYRNGERHREVDGRQVDNYVTDDFLVDTAYGCHVVVTNPTSTRQDLQVLLQIPEGALPLAGMSYTRSLNVALEPYRTWTIDYLFYFPRPGTFRHFPVHVARDEELLAFAAPTRFAVREGMRRLDSDSWEYVSQDGTEDEVLAFLRTRNLYRVDLDGIAWRMKRAPFARDVLATLRQRHVYDHTLWSYALLHNLRAAITQYLEHSPDFLARCGATIDSPLVRVDPVERRSYQHREYWPLINARAHLLGKTRQILNDRFFEQYIDYLEILRYRLGLAPEDRVAMVIYLLLQDRVEEALSVFAEVRQRDLVEKIEYDYLEAYLAFYTENLGRARALAQNYADHPVERWRGLFTEVTRQLDEIEGERRAPRDEDDRDERQAQLAAAEPAIDFEINGSTVTLHYQNVERCAVEYYLMDLELLFSRNPFLETGAEQFATIQPNGSEAVQLDPTATTHTFELPERFRSANLLVEVRAGSVSRARTHLANALSLQVSENYGQVRVADEAAGRPLPRVYVKVYARLGDGTVRFYKDGYTDLRGRFDYSSVSTRGIGNVERFAILLLSEDHGARVEEAAPPKV